MQTAKKPANEVERLEALVQYDILDSETEEEYDDIARIAAHVCNVPVAIISFIDKDRKWHKAKVGVAADEMKRDIAVCSHTIVSDQELMVVEDTRKDDRFVDSPVHQSVNPVIFYAGVKLRNFEGFVLGTLCVVDHKPNQINDEQRIILESLGKQVMQLLEHRRNTHLLRKIKDYQREQYHELEEFTHTVIHDINSPMANIVGVADLLETEINAEEGLSKEIAEQYVGLIKRTGLNIKLFMTELLDYYRADSLSNIPPEKIKFREWLTDLIQMLDPHHKHNIILPQEEYEIRVRKVALRHVFSNLIQNAIKHNPTEELEVRIGFEDKGKSYEFFVSDNGQGIASDDQEKLFEPLTTLNKKTSGTGLGLAIVKKIIEKEHGEINLSSDESTGSIFTFVIMKN